MYLSLSPVWKGIQIPAWISHVNPTLEKQEVPNQSNRFIGESESLHGRDDLGSGDMPTEGRAFPSLWALEGYHLSYRAPFDFWESSFPRVGPPSLPPCVPPSLPSCLFRSLLNLSLPSGSTAVPQWSVHVLWI